MFDLIKRILKERKIVKGDPFIEIWTSNYKSNKRLGLLNPSSKKFKSISSLKKILNGNMGILLLGDGPSLDDNIQLIKNTNNSFFIICQDAVLYNCLKAGIQPHLVVTIDPQEIIKSFWCDLKTENLCLVASVLSHPESLKSWKGDIIYYNQSDPMIYKDIVLKLMTFDSILTYDFLKNLGCVLNTMIQLALLMKPKFIILCGYDFSYSITKHYCKYFFERRSKYLGVTVDYLKESEDKLKVTILEKDSNRTVVTSNLFLIYASLALDLIKKTDTLILNSSKEGLLGYFLPFFDLKKFVKNLRKENRSILK